MVRQLDDLVIDGELGRLRAVARSYSPDALASAKLLLSRAAWRLSLNGWPGALPAQDHRMRKPRAVCQ